MKLNTFILAIFLSLAVWVPVQAGEMPPLPDPSVMSNAYWTLWNDWVQRDIDYRIEQHRKADATVFLTDVQPGTEVRIEQIANEFLFGANIFNFDQLGSKEMDDRYKAIFGELFNSASISFYWRAIEQEEGKIHYAQDEEDNPEFWAKVYNAKTDPNAEKYWRRPAPDPVIEFCEQKGIFRHGHPIAWGNVRHNHPTWLPMTEENVPKIEAKYEERVRQLAERYGNRINRWDVVNESAVDMLNPHHSKYDPTSPKGSYGILPRDYTFKIFKLANEVFPHNVVLSINDYDMGFGYINQISDLRLRGIRIDMVGMQMHLFNPKQCADIAKGAKIQNPEYLVRLMDDFTKTGLPLHLSEITITAPDDTPEGREIQANITRNLYRMWFSWPTMQAVTWWNIVDDCGLKGEPTTSGLTTRTVEKKPAYHALDRLINHEWKTRIKIKADEKRFKHQFRGFKGKYRVSWTDSQGQARAAELDVR